MKKALLSLAAVAVLGAGAYGAWRAWAVPSGRAGAPATALVERGILEDTVSATGTVQPRDYVDVGTQVSGQVKTLHVEIGDVVKKGDLLAEIDPTVYLAKVDADQAQLANLQAQLIDRQAQLKLAEQKAQRQANQANLGYTKIYAPMAGTVVTQAAKEGQTLNANQQAPIVMRIADLSTMTVVTQVSEADVPRLRLGMRVYFTTLGDQRKRWYGTLRQIYPTPEVVNNVVLFDALFDVPNPDGTLMTQMTTQVFFVVAEAKDAVLAPLSALRRTGQGRGTVNIVDAEGRTQTREVELGVSNRVSVQVLSGLEPGEQVATSERPQRGARTASAAPTPRMGPRL
jgi:macrolide-specific efflux system membrane fusion protein